MWICKVGPCWLQRMQNKNRPRRAAIGGHGSSMEMENNFDLSECSIRTQIPLDRCIWAISNMYDFTENAILWRNTMEMPPSCAVHRWTKTNTKHDRDCIVPLPLAQLCSEKCFFLYQIALRNEIILFKLSHFVKSAFHDGKQPNWFHSECFFKKQRPVSETLFDGFPKLRIDDQKYIKENISKFLANACIHR